MTEREKENARIRRNILRRRSLAHNPVALAIFDEGTRKKESARERLHRQSYSNDPIKRLQYESGILKPMPGVWADIRANAVLLREKEESEKTELIKARKEEEKKRYNKLFEHTTTLSFSNKKGQKFSLILTYDKEHYKDIVGAEMYSPEYGSKKVMISAGYSYLWSFIEDNFRYFYQDLDDANCFNSLSKESLEDLKEAIMQEYNKWTSGMYSANPINYEYEKLKSKKKQREPFFIRLENFFGKNINNLGTQYNTNILRIYIDKKWNIEKVVYETTTSYYYQQTYDKKIIDRKTHGEDAIWGFISNHIYQFIENNNMPNFDLVINNLNTEDAKRLIEIIKIQHEENLLPKPMRRERKVGGQNVR